MDRASRALARGVPAGVPKSYRALADHSGVPRSTLHHRKNKRRSIEEKAESQLYLWPTEAKAVIEYLLQMSNLGHPVQIKHIPYIAFRATRHRPLLSRPSKPPGKNWPKAFEKRYPEEKIVHWFEVIGKVLNDPAILAENVYNMDETGVMLSMPGSVKVLVAKDDTRDYRGARVKRTTVTAIECVSADGRYLTPMIIWPATTHRSNWTTFPTPGWYYTCTESGYTNSKISLEWLKRVFDPQTKQRANGRPRVLICDGFGTHETLEILEFCFENNIILCRLPSHTSHKLQPCDVAAFAPLKAAYREQVDRLERGGVNTIGKEHFTALYSPARVKAFTARNIKAGFAKPTEEPTVATSGLVPCSRQDEVLQTLASPTTPKTSEAFASLQDLIIEQDAHALDEESKLRLRRHIQKFVNAGEMCLVRGALQQDRIRFLTTINNEARPRKLADSKILEKGEGKVMKYEDLEARRSARAANDRSKAEAKGNRGRKRKSREADVETMTKVARTTLAQPDNAVPVAQMY